MWVPQAHGAWAWWILPVAVGLAAAGRAPPDVAFLVGAALATFLLHQPATTLVRVLAGRRARAELGPALVAASTYGVLALVAVVALVLEGHRRFLGLALPGGLVFAWHLALVARAGERRQRLVEMLGAAVLALWAPAAYWVAGGTRYPEPWALWWIGASHSAGAIQTVYLRLAQRRLDPRRARGERAPPGALALARPALLVDAAALFGTAALAALDLVPWGAAWATLLPLADATLVARHPTPPAMPRRIGVHQLAVTTAFAALVVTSYLIP